MKRVYVDVETTGISRTAGAVVIEVAAVVREDGVELAYCTSLCNPGAEALKLPDAEKALAVNRISVDDILAAPSIADVAKSLNEFLDIKAEGALLHAFNKSFDSKFLELEPWGIRKERWGECVMMAARKVMEVGRFPSLEQARTHFAIANPDAHRALADARVAGLLYEAIERARS